MPIDILIAVFEMPLRLKHCKPIKVYNVSKQPLPPPPDLVAINLYTKYIAKTFAS